MKKPTQFTKKNSREKETIQFKKTPPISFASLKKDIENIGKRFAGGKKTFSQLLRKYEVFLILCILCILSIPILFFLILYFLVQINSEKLSKMSFPQANAKRYPSYDNKNVLATSASAYVVYEIESRVMVVAKNEQFRFSPASTAKIMTALISAEKYPLQKTLTARNVQRIEGSKMGLDAGEVITVENLLYGLMLPSGNDAAVTLAQNYPGGIAGFVRKMNEKANELKLYNTQFFDPSGYDDRNYITAFDLARLTAAAIKNNTISRIVKTKSKTVYNKQRSIEHKLVNLNKLLDKQGTTGVKTGFTEEAGGVLVTSFVESGKTYIIVVLRSEDRFADTEMLIENVVKSVRLLKY